MNIRLVDNTFDSNKFNKCAPHPLQSWEWGEARAKMGIELIRVGEFDNEILKNVFQLTFHKIPYTSFTIGYLPRSVIPSSQVLDFLKEEAKKRNCIFIKVEPYVTKGNSNLNGIAASQAPRDDVLIKSNHGLFPNWTQIIDLTKTEEELLKNLHPKTRYNIGLAKKRGVVITEMTNEEGFEIFQKLYFETCKRQGYRGHDNEYHKIVFETLKDKIGHIFVANYVENGKTTPLASYHVFTFNDVMYYVYGGSSLEHKNVMAPNLLMWEVIQFGKKNGFSTFDMWGSSPPDYDRNNPWGGFTRFKEGYGGQFVEFVGSYDFVLNRLLYQLYSLAYSIRRKLL